MRGYGLWTVKEQHSSEFVGQVGCWNPEGWPGFEIGWMLRREFWRRGYATEAAQAAVKFTFTELDQLRVISLMHPDNAASIRVAERLGETFQGRAEVMGHNALVYEMSRRDD